MPMLAAFIDFAFGEEGKAMDAINRTQGKGIVHFARCGTDSGIPLRQDHRSPRYTTHWEEILKIWD